MPTARGAGLAAQLPLFDAGALVAAAPRHPLSPPTTGRGRLVALPFGAGQESTTLLYLYRYSASFRARYVPDGRLVVIFCNMGDEHANTYAHVADVAQFCAASAIPFVRITGDMGYHTGHWRDGLVGQFRATRTIMGVAFPKSCSDQLKISPFYKYLEAYVAREYSLGEATRKQAFYRYARLYGPLRVLIGVAAGEERRLARAGAATTIARSRPRTTGPVRRTTPPVRWMQRCIERAYPLIDLGLTRADGQAYIQAVGHTVPPPSLCRRCPFSTLRELWWRWQYDRGSVEEWFMLERDKLAANSHRGDKNYPVLKTMTLPEALVLAQQRYGHLSFAQLDALRMQEGHCVQTRF